MASGTDCARQRDPALGSAGKHMRTSLGRSEFEERKPTSRSKHARGLAENARLYIVRQVLDDSDTVDDVEGCCGETQIRDRHTHKRGLWDSRPRLSERIIRPVDARDAGTTAGEFLSPAAAATTQIQHAESA